jgi:uncharacterized protein YehS (DUF1456 family)
VNEDTEISKRQQNQNSTMCMNNYVLRRVAYALTLNMKGMLETFNFADYSLSDSELKGYLLKDEQDGFMLLPDYILIIFLDALIIQKRGKKEGAENLSQSERVKLSKKESLTNNMLLTKLKIAFNLKAEDLIEILLKADFRISKGELSAFSRNSEHRNFRPCGNQLIRNLLTGLTLKFRLSEES